MNHDDQPTIDGSDLPPPERPAGGATEAPEIANYKMVQKIAQGGMGEIWLADQTAPVKRRVAIKVIKKGMDSSEIIARFDTERQALAVMDHPNIAKVFDAGITRGGSPYFAMEFVQGIPISDYCDRHHLGVEERLRLFIRVCEGIQHAHHKAVIHRDLKPSNILVSEHDGRPVPKIIDFGVAKATAADLPQDQGLTSLGQMIGTPEYMSPEQAEMTEASIDTRTDVYALGVVLYELLVGALPFDSRELRRAGFDELRRTIREVDPARPSTRVGTLAGTPPSERRQVWHPDPRTLRRELKGDLDWITMKALEKDRERRYSSASEFAADIERHLRDEPVLASPPSAAYKTRKFVRRHRFGVTFAAAVLMLLVGFAVTMAVQAERIARERDRANQEARTAREVSDFLVDLFDVSDPSEALGNVVTAREILDAGAAKIETALAGEPRVQGRLMDTMGEVYRKLGLYDKARPLMEKAKQILDDPSAASSLDLASALEHYGMLLIRVGDPAAAKPLLERGLALRLENLGPNNGDVASAENNLGSLALATGDLVGARKRYADAIASWEKASGKDHPDVARGLTNLAIVEVRAGNTTAARSLYERAIAIVEKAHGPDHPDVAQALYNYAGLLRTMGDLDEARKLNERALAIREKVFGPDHPDVARSLNSLANVLEKQGDHEGARVALERSLTIREKTLGPDHPDLAQSHNNLAIALKSLGAYDRARGHYLQAIEIWRRSPVDQGSRIARAQYNLGGLAALQGDRSTALDLLGQAIAAGFADKAIFDDDDFKSLHGDPRFERLEAQVRARLAPRTRSEVKKPS